MSAISVQDLTKDFAGVRAVDHVSFDVPHGAVTGFIGANGSGKTTTMRLALGLTAAATGQVLFDGCRYVDLPAPRRRVGAVLERVGSHPSHTARQHLSMIAINAGLGRELVERSLDEVGLLSDADRPVRQFSMGMMQRCALAAALLGRPRTLLLDEPANGLDPTGIRWLRNSIRGWADEGRAVLVSTHQLAELEMVVDHLVVLHRGRVVHQGPADTTLQSGQSLEASVFDLLAELGSAEGARA